MDISIRLMQPSDAPKWDDYVTRHPDGSFFHLISWKEVIESAFGHPSYYLIAEKKAESSREENTSPEWEKLAGVFPLFSITSLLFGKSMVSVPFGAYGGILANDSATETALLEYAKRLTNEQNLDYLEIRNEKKILPGLHLKDLYYVFKKPISLSPEENLKAIPRKSRAMVRKGIQYGLTFRIGRHELLDPFYQMFSYNYRRLGTPVFSKAYLDALLDILKHQATIAIAYKDRRPLSGVLSFYFKDQAIPYYSGAYPEAMNYAANDFLYWALMSDAAEKGFRIFDYGRSKKGTGPFHFKKNWGFTPRPLFYQYHLNAIKEIPNISPANPKYQWRINLWKKLPLTVTEFLGPKIVKYIP